MSFMVRAITIYSYNGDLRTLNFRTGGMNVITGGAGTGKSSIIDILDYCFGRSECYVAEGEIRRHVSWFGVEIENGTDILFIARRNPGPTIKTSPDIYIRRGNYESPPIYPDLQKNIIEDELIRLLTRFCGIAENENRPISGTRLPLQATIRHALFLCIQRQDEIASRDRLFHRQGEPFIPQAIKDTIPFFLGAVDEDHFVRQNELDLARTKLRELEAKKAEQEKSPTRDLLRLRRLVIDGKRVGIVDERFESEDVQETLKVLRAATNLDVQQPNLRPDAGDLINRLQDEQHTLRQNLTNTVEDIRATRLFLSEQSVFSRETGEQHARLLSINLYKNDEHDAVTCPVCQSKLESQPPSTQALRSSLERLERQLISVAAESPHLSHRLDELNRKKLNVEVALTENQNLLERAYMDDARAQGQREAVIERARVAGRISALLEHSMTPDDVSGIEGELQSARLLVNALEEKINADDIEQRLDTFLNIISRKMTDYAGELELEHGGDTVRLDLKRLTVVADTASGPISLNRMGSGENWIGYHVLTHLAIHWWLRLKNRPVPALLIFDQPSQAHYPPDRDDGGRLDPLKDSDRRAVHALFELMYKACEEIGMAFQLIVIDHAHLGDDWFEKSIVEEWRNGRALVPAEWIESESSL